MKFVVSRLGLRRRLFCVSVLGLGLSGGLVSTAVMAHGKEEEGVRHVMMATFHKPTDPLTVDPVVVRGDHAVAGWLQAGRGGRAVLQRVKGHWTITVCGGDGLKSAQALEQTGMPAASAKALAQDLAKAESRLSPQVVQKFSMFEGIVKVQSGHGEHHGAAKPASHPAPKH